MRVQPVEVGQGASDGKSQLCPGAQPRMRRQGAFDLYGCFVREVMVVQELASEGGRSLGVLAFDGKHAGPRR